MTEDGRTLPGVGLSSRLGKTTPDSVAGHARDYLP